MVSDWIGQKVRVYLKHELKGKRKRIKRLGNWLESRRHCTQTSVLPKKGGLERVGGRERERERKDKERKRIFKCAMYSVWIL
jgi:hypothetical protein